MKFKSKMGTSILGVAFALGVLCAEGSTAFASTVVVDPSDMGNWVFVNDKGSGGSGTFVEGPGTPPLGTGSAQLSVTGSGNAEILFNYNTLAGTPLADITSLSYDNYVVSSPGSNAQSPSFNFDINLNAGVTSYQGRLVFEPYFGNGGTVPSGTWNSWNTLTATSGWWFSNNTVFPNCTQSNPCTWTQVLADYPDAVINNDQEGGFGFKVGSGWDSFVGNVDDLTIGVNGVNTTYNFEVPEPASLSLFAVALIGLWGFEWRRRRTR